MRALVKSSIIGDFTRAFFVDLNKKLWKTEEN